ncbi:MAG: hypothetical protein C4318_07445 [Acidimicrobiia bacterium]
MKSPRVLRWQKQSQHRHAQLREGTNLRITHPVTLLNTARASATSNDHRSSRLSDVCECSARSDLSVIVPAFNEEKTLQKTLPSAIEVASSHGSCELIVVDDGSTDDTLRVAGRILENFPRSELIWHPHNRGKGAAVKSGVTRARGKTIVFVDADLAPDLRTGLDRAIKELESADVAIASRALPDSEVVGATVSRRALGLGFRTLRRMLFDLEVADTQCGLKAFRAGPAKVLFHSLRSTGFVFDVELLLTARWLGLDVAEFPVRWVAYGASAVNPIVDSAMMAAGLLRLRFRSQVPPPVPCVEFFGRQLDFSHRSRLVKVLRHGDLVVHREDRIAILLFCSPLEAARAVAGRIPHLFDLEDALVSSIPGDEALRLAREAFNSVRDDVQFVFA